MPVQDDGVVRGEATESAPIAAATTRYRMLERIAFTFAFAALLAASPAYGECKSYVDASGIQYDDPDASYSAFTPAVAPVRVEEPACRLDIVHP